MREKGIETATELLGIDPVKNYGDVLYNYRFRRPLPEIINSKAPEGRFWIIRLAGKARYRFVAVETAAITPSDYVATIKVPDVTPGIIVRYALGDEQALLARLRYNRLLDICVGITCYSMQSHLRTTVPDVGQVETDELYVGIDRHGAHYVLPVQAKGRGDRLGIVQVEQDVAMCANKFRDLICRPIGAQFIAPDLIALFQFEGRGYDISLRTERHYRLVAPNELTAEELDAYRQTSEQPGPA
jgi:hypothetical protein